MSNQLLTLFQHNLWANAKLFAVCAALDPSHLAAADPGAYGSVYATLVHILDAEQWYVWLLKGEPEPHGLLNLEQWPASEQLTIAQMRPHIEKSGQELMDLAAAAETLSPKKDGASIAAGIVLAQALTHATEHRTNITTILARLGIPNTDVSVWRYYEFGN